MNGVTQSSQKANALIALFELGGQSRELTPVLTKMRERGINSDIHNLAHVMWPLSKENLVTFLERKNGPRHTSTLVNLSLTDLGRDRAMALLGMSVGKLPSPMRIASSGRAAHAVGQDRTDFRRHADVAVGGPIERIKKENPMDHVPFVVLSDEEAARFRTSSPQAARQLARQQPKTQTDTPESHTDEESLAEVSGMPAEGDGMSAAENTPTQYRDGDTPREYSEEVKVPVHVAKRVLDFNRDDFPEIVSVLGKQARIDRYTKAAELLGDDEAEIAITLLEKVKISPLEAEIIRLLG